MLNADGRVWADRLGQAMQPVCHMAPASAESLIAIVASTIRSTVTHETPILECELPLAAPFGGARFEARPSVQQSAQGLLGVHRGSVCRD